MFFTLRMKTTVRFSDFWESFSLIISTNIIVNNLPHTADYSLKFSMPLFQASLIRIVTFTGQTSEDIDVLDLMRRYNTDVIASTGFGLQIDSIKDKNNKFFTIGEQAVTFTFCKRMYYFLTIQFPIVAKIMQVCIIVIIFLLNIMIKFTKKRAQRVSFLTNLQ